MKADPVKGDWSELVKGDFENFDIILTEDEIREMDIQVINKRKSEGILIFTV